MKRLKFCWALLAAALLFDSCGNGGGNNDNGGNKGGGWKDEYTGIWTYQPADPGGGAVPVSFDVNTEYQTIEGFGGFGARDVWWNNANLYTDAWAEMLIGDMGMTMWRNELYPHDPVNKRNLDDQDADWPKQKPVVEGLVRTAKKLGVDLKIILTVWSAPPAFKDNGSTKGGGYVTSGHYKEFADWLISGLDLYHNEIGHDVYALSFQNEPAFPESYNAGVYQVHDYVACLNYIYPKIKEKYPKVKIFGSEHMLQQEVEGNWAFIPSIIAGGANMDAWAVHGYSDGVLSMAVEAAGNYWTSLRNMVSSTGKPLWMTETSGFVEDWLGGDWKNYKNMPGTFSLAYMIAVALQKGHLSAWTYWGISELEDIGSPYSIMAGEKKNKRYYVSKQFYHYIRPGAKMVGVTCDDKELRVIPFSHKEERRFTVMVLNDSAKSKKINLLGNALGSNFMMYQTTEASKVDCIATYLNASNPRLIVVPGKSVVTLVNSNY
jgi:O-glycosyl hydrolase